MWKVSAFLDLLKRLHQPLCPSEEIWHQYCLLAQHAIIIQAYMGGLQSSVKLRILDNMAQQGHACPLSPAQYQLLRSLHITVSSRASWHSTRRSREYN